MRAAVVAGSPTAGGKIADGRGRAVAAAGDGHTDRACGRCGAQGRSRSVRGHPARIRGCSRAAPPIEPATTMPPCTTWGKYVRRPAGPTTRPPPSVGPAWTRILPLSSWVVTGRTRIPRLSGRSCTVWARGGANRSVAIAHRTHTTPAAFFGWSIRVSVTPNPMPSGVTVTVTAHTKVGATCTAVVQYFPNGYHPFSFHGVPEVATSGWIPGPGICSPGATAGKPPSCAPRVAPATPAARPSS